MQRTPFHFDLAITAPDTIVKYTMLVDLEHWKQENFYGEKPLWIHEDAAEAILNISECDQRNFSVQGLKGDVVVSKVDGNWYLNFFEKGYCW